MTKINWKQKLTSRKFWVALIGFITALMTALNYSELTIAQVTGVAAALAPLVVYILSEGYVDGKRAGTQPTPLIIGTEEIKWQEGESVDK